MVYRFTSSKSILGRVKRLVDSSDWLGIAPIYIADAVQKIGLNYSTIYKVTSGNDIDSSDECMLEVENHLVDLPSDLDILVKIECNGSRLAYSPDKSLYGMRSCDDYSWGKQYHDCNSYYTIDNGRIRTSFESGKIKIFYKALQCDEEGFIMIPDVAEYKEALVWQLFSDLLLEGVKPKYQNMSFEQAESRAEDKISKARGRLKQLTKDERDALSKMITSTNIENSVTSIFPN